MRQTKLKPRSKKRQAQAKVEYSVKLEIYEKGDSLCELCREHLIADRGHEIKFRSKCGDPTDPFNIIQLCLRCHDREQGHTIGELPHTKEELYQIVRKLRLAQGYKEEE